MEEYLKEKVWALQRENYRLEEQIKDLKKQVGLLEQIIKENNLPSVGDFNPTVRKVHERIDKQQLKGYQKYGKFVDPHTHHISYWLEHLAQELSDALVYIQSILDLCEKLPMQPKGCRKCQSNSKKEEYALVANVES